MNTPKSGRGPTLHLLCAIGHSRYVLDILPATARRAPPRPCHLPMPDPQHSCVFLECSPGAKGTLIAALYPVLKHQIPFSVAEISQPKPLQAVKNGALNSERGVQMKKFLLGS